MNWTLLISLLGLAPMLIMLALMYLQLKRLDADDRREAITTDLRNLPAASTQKRRDELIEGQMSRLFSAMVLGSAGALAIVNRRVTGDLSNWNWLDTSAVLFVVGCGVYYGLQVFRAMPHGRRLRQAIRAEQASAQELAASLAGDNRIIHDLQAGEFNIDHVVITPVGVFAVETKSRLKPPAGSGSPKVKYDGKGLDFGGWKETKPIDQADRQARWLRNFLRESTGESYPVFAVLALPGWFIENTARISDDMVRVINPKRSQWLLLPEKRPTRLNAAAIQRAAFAIEKLAQRKE